MKSRYFSSANEFANQNFSNYSGGWNNLMPDLGYSSADGAVQTGGATSLPYNFIIANSSTANIDNVVVLGANVNTVNGVVNFGNSADISITMDNAGITYGTFLESLKSQPFTCGQIYLQSQNSSQVLKTLTITYRESGGVIKTVPVYPRLDPSQNIANVVIVRDPKFPVDAYTSITTTILGSATLNMYLYPMAVVDPANTLVGRGSERVYSAPNLSQLILPRG
jgi:hypothetical protein